LGEGLWFFEGRKYEAIVQEQGVPERLISGVSPDKFRNVTQTTAVQGRHVIGDLLGGDAKTRPKEFKGRGRKRGAKGLEGLAKVLVVEGDVR
jgi:hypothetical protein